MPKIGYTEPERERIREALINSGLELMAQQGIQHTTVEQIYNQVGISRTFFYSFFPTKEDLIVEAFYHQQPRIIKYMQNLKNNPDLSLHDCIRQFIYDCCYGKENRFAVMTVEDQQSIFKHLSSKNNYIFRKKQIDTFTKILEVFNIHTDESKVKLICNQVLSIIIVRKAIPDTLPFLFPDSADEMVDFQIDVLVEFMKTLQSEQVDSCLK